MLKNSTDFSSWVELPGLKPVYDSLPIWAEIIKKNLFPVLIVGDSGTGKSAVRDKLLSLLGYKQNDERVAIVNMAAIPEDLLESELFGYTRGAFTGAEKDRQGLLGNKKYEIVVMEEIGTLPKPLQAKLLVFLDNGLYRRVGDDKISHSTTKILGTTNIDPDSQEGAKVYRKDFKWRFKNLKIPPLYQRREDVLILFDWYVRKVLGDYDVNKGYYLTVEDIVTVLCYPWPGGAREIKNVATFFATQIKHYGRGKAGFLLELDDVFVCSVVYKKIMDSINNKFPKCRSKLNKASSLFYLRSIREPCDLARVDAPFWLNFLFLKELLNEQKNPLKIYESQEGLRDLNWSTWSGLLYFKPDIGKVIDVLKTLRASNELLNKIKLGMRSGILEFLLNSYDIHLDSNEILKDLIYPRWLVKVGESIFDIVQKNKSLTEITQKLLNDNSLRSDQKLLFSAPSLLGSVHFENYNSNHHQESSCSAQTQIPSFINILLEQSWKGAYGLPHE